MSPLLLTALALAADPRLDTLDGRAWRDLGARPSPSGEITIRRAEVDGVACHEGTLTTDVDRDALLAVGRDMVSAGRWSSARLAASEELSRVGDRYVLFQYYDVPAWTMAADRYWMIEVEVDAARDRFRWSRVDVADHPDIAARALARSAGAVEPPVSYGEWRFQPVDGGTQVRYRACADFGGAVPEAIARWVTTSQLPATVSDLVEEARRR